MVFNDIQFSVFFCCALACIVSNTAPSTFPQTTHTHTQVERSFCPEKADGLQGKTVCSCSKLVGDSKVGPEDWLVQNFELKTDCGFVNYKIHQTAVNMPHNPTKAMWTISIMELSLWSAQTVPHFRRLR